MLVSYWRSLRLIDLSAPLGADKPVTWPGLPPFRNEVLNWFERSTLPNGSALPSIGAFYDQLLLLDEHTGTHVDHPCHILPPDELAALGLPARSPLEQFAGPAAVLDARSFLDAAEPGRSPRVSLDALLAWERENGKLESGEVLLIDTGYLDRYFRPYPEGARFLKDVIAGTRYPGWPVPAEEMLAYAGERGIRHVGISSPSIGALDDPLGPHRAGMRLGMSYSEMLIGLDRLPPRGAIYFALPLNVEHQSGSPVRAVALTEAGTVARRDEGD
ncbi:MAG: cyclase family protein [Rhodospirillales bacterium]|nr:cyclase family protein [Rhodospirillales bacterium]